MKIRISTAAIAALALVAAAGAAAPKWTFVPAVPLPAGVANSQLRAVTAVSARDLWVGGAWWDKTQVHPLLAHWDGTAWTVPALPALPQDAYLTGVDAVGAGDVWAVGSTAPGLAPNSPSTPSVLHYDGLTWRPVPTPALPAGSANDLDAIDMRTAGDGWAVGETSTGSLAQPLILRWRAGEWIGSPVPKSAGASGGLVAVAAAAADDVWAVGTEVDTATGAGHGLVLHFDGATWSRAELSTPAGTTLDAVAVAGPGDVWAAGRTCGLACAAAVWHLTAAGWQPVPPIGGTEVAALVAFGPDDVWTLGYQLLPNNRKADHVEHWDGKRFTAEDTGLPTLPPPGGNQGELGSATPIFAAAGVPETGELWAVGWSDPPAVAPRMIHRG
ncbi:hypothetical protein ACFQFC_11545 [Amorphoplanes digitatis]|uniref:LigA protein n=1 Tax=Actinoplanes digitatis TaxID=1868 RepID=A0A7W7I1U7_9ACTN|nr:hypothetical protein [Actinoplanes digitatis]MBB4764837.1 hypothetical protein [Actinoplanes digitatis]GID91209.1 hypothetical protein Adi01nite_06210 [Actinoplanes digitatis]